MLTFAFSLFIIAMEKFTMLILTIFVILCKGILSASIFFSSGV